METQLGAAHRYGEPRHYQVTYAALEEFTRQTGRLRDALIFAKPLPSMVGTSTSEQELSSFEGFVIS